MTYSLSGAALPPLRVTLDMLSGLLDKAGAFAADRKIDPSVLLSMRLAPDMLPLTRQIQIVTDQAKNGMSRLAGVEPPRFEDTETTIAELKARLARTRAYLDTLDTAAIDAATQKQIVFPMGPEKKGRMQGDDYFRHFMLPNVHFHASIAYAILRHAGLQIGKTDYLGQIPLERL